MKRLIGLMVGGLIVVTVAACSDTAATTTVDNGLNEITATSGGWLGVFNGVTCEIDSNDLGTMTGESEEGGSITIKLTEDNSTVVIDNPDFQADAEVISAENDGFAILIEAAPPELHVDAVISQWDACS